MCRRAEMSDVLHAIIVGNGTTGYAARGEQRYRRTFFSPPIQGSSHDLAS